MTISKLPFSINHQSCTLVKLKLIEMVKMKITPKVKVMKKKQPNAVGIKPHALGQLGLHSSLLFQSATMPPWTATLVREKRTADNKIVTNHRGE